ncbi:MAG: DUF1559 domain-containing protein, partial [Phycisphaerales bacterium]|nr:DUF1559 domain-containing protein [Phycisphaerales bacterium]
SGPVDDDGIETPRRSLVVGSLRPNRNEAYQNTGACRGFTLLDLLVSIAVIAVLIGILLPSLKMVHDTSRRVVCASNLRQIGLGVHMYATDNDEVLPYTSYANRADNYWGTDPLSLRVDGRTRNIDQMPWDGLGVLFDQSYLGDGQIFYCPSHTGNHSFETYAAQFAGEDGEVIANYGYRGAGPDVQDRPSIRLDYIVDTAAMVSDGFREAVDINHAKGMNVLRAGMHVDWRTVDHNWMLDMASQAGDNLDDPNWDDRWRLLDEPTLNSGFWGGLFD